MAWFSKGLAVALATSALTLPGVALAQDGELPVAVLTIQTLDAFEQADALSLALKRVVEEANGWSTAKTERDYALQALVPSLGCTDPPDAACEEKISQEIKVDRFIWGRMKMEGKEVVGDLHFWVKGKGSTATTFKYSSNLTVAVDEALTGIARQKLDELTGGTPGGRVILHVGTFDGTVTVDGKPAGVLKQGMATVDLPAGPHVIAVEVPGYSAVSTRVEIAPREARDITLSPTPEPDAGPPYQQIFGFTLLGLGAVSAGIGTYGGIRAMQLSSELEDKYASDIPSGKSACDPGPKGDYPNAQGASSSEIIKLCQDGDTVEMMHFVAFPVAGALAATGIILLATADWGGGSEKDAASLPVQVVPSFGPQGADVSMTVRF
ncbi:MAG: PEGA domain-containing protein [Myxococcales bacterium]|nr:PEGA domain-containing protein [Myxococcales bacterium]